MDGKAEVMPMTAHPNNVALTKQAVAESLGQLSPIDIEWEQVANIPKDWAGPLRWDHPQSACPQILDHHAGLIEVTPKRTKVCIVGYAENSRHLAWWDDPDCEIWGVNQLDRFIPRADRWFQMHTDWHDATKWAKGTDQRAWLQACPIPVYMLDHDPQFPNSVRYPIERVMAELGMHDYFTSTIAFMTALAIAEGFQHIAYYGIDLIIGREYQFEKPCVEFLLGIATARGLHVHKPDGCALLWQSHRYGYEQEPDFGFYSLSKLKARANQLLEQVRLLRDEVKVWQGRAEEAKWVHAKLDQQAQGNMAQHIEELEQKVDKALNRLYMHDGAQQEVQRMHDIMELRHRGGQVE